MKDCFLTHLFTEDAGPGFYILTEPFRAFSNRLKRVVEVPRGFPTDFASARIGNWQLRGKTEKPAVIHDLLFATGEAGLFGAGLVFYDMLRCSGVGRFRSTVYALAATVTPGARRAWKLHRRGQSKAAHFLRGQPGVASATNYP